MIRCIINKSQLFTFLLQYSFIFIASGCNMDITFTKDLGMRYGLDRYNYMLYATYPNKVYKFVIPYQIHSYNYDDNWIVAKTITDFPLLNIELEKSINIYKLDLEDTTTYNVNTTYYWIINKLECLSDSEDIFFHYFFDGFLTCTQFTWVRPGNVMGPLDYSAFIETKEKLGIKLEPNIRLKQLYRNENKLSHKRI